jgi:hypothetical protein
MRSVQESSRVSRLPTLATVKVTSMVAPAAAVSGNCRSVTRRSGSR